MKNKFAYILLSAVLLSACSTDLDVVGKYKETMVVYGLLDQSTDTQYVKINKAYLGEGNAFQMAQIKDSTQYVKTLNVTINRVKNGTVVSSYNLQLHNFIPKETGVFYAPDQANAIYSFYAPVGTLSTDGIYKLSITNSDTKTEVSSQTSLISGATFTSPPPSSPSPSYKIIIPSNQEATFAVRWTSGANAKMYQLTVRFNYIDSTTSGNISKHLDWLFPVQTTLGLSGGESMQGDFVGLEFFKYIANQLPTVNPISAGELWARKAGKVEFLLTSGGDDFNTFIEVNAPSTSIVQEKPEYTNITNGLGVFSARLHSTAFGKPMDANSINELSCGETTRSLNFLNAQGQPCP